MNLQDKLEVTFPRAILVKNIEVKRVTVRLPTVKDDLNATALSRFMTPTGHMQVDTLEKEVYMISALTNIPKTDMDGLNRVNYGLLVDAVGKLELALESPILEPKSEESK